ncbi:ubiquinone biosynthesis accessory factor UbiK [Spiribacter halobius]|uniref:Ubiquinone biosynthesis accessory factor UbiK n=1 Tax=Sediminicurvatus halobius TaxID=2182432 RepID=A0A2U2MW13_9GAMM|nr:accessory factor UbiK family protein [Spiribacter halobius]PWG61012.1 hypothetical protein DEM34_18605 [Spiribacter halobius]UEX77621.1 accessory factor UbiK family protein [Spiribacter halobius]
MLDPRQLDELARRFSEHLPSGLRDFQQEVEKNTRVALQSAFNRMELVTRDEFDAQTKVLARTRERLEALEQRIAALEGGNDGDAAQPAGGSPAPQE